MASKEVVPVLLILLEITKYEFNFTVKQPKGCLNIQPYELQHHTWNCLYCILNTSNRNYILQSLLYP